jgi:hypothetical protein
MTLNPFFIAAFAAFTARFAALKTSFGLIY